MTDDNEETKIPTNPLERLLEVVTTPEPSATEESVVDEAFLQRQASRRKFVKGGTREQQLEKALQSLREFVLTEKHTPESATELRILILDLATRIKVR